MNFFDRLKEGLKKTRKGLMEKVEAIFKGGALGEESLEELEETLIRADVGAKAAGEITNFLRSKEREICSAQSRETAARELLKKEMALLLGNKEPLVIYGEKPFVILVVGVNGVGKTTTIGKMASRFASEGKTVIMAAGDTFRAAAIEQLDIWSKRAGAQLIKHQSGSDPAAVAFDAIEAARHRGADVVIVDTAGRLHTKSPLMDELKKVRRVIEKAMPGAPHEVLLVLDATTGQNALRQAHMFGEAVNVTGIALTKLDGTAKGGIVFAIRKELGIPVRLIGVGEGADDLRDFDPGEFVEALFSA